MKKEEKKISYLPSKWWWFTLTSSNTLPLTSRDTPNYFISYQSISTHLQSQKLQMVQLPYNINFHVCVCACMYVCMYESAWWQISIPLEYNLLPRLPLDLQLQKPEEHFNENSYHDFESFIEWILLMVICRCHYNSHY